MRILTTFLLFVSIVVNAQVGINTDIPNDATALDIHAENTINFGGLKLPVVTEAQRTNNIAVTAASEGTMVFVTYARGVRCLEIYDGIERRVQRKVGYCHRHIQR